MAGILSAVALATGSPYYFEVTVIECGKYNATFFPIVSQSQFRQTVFYKLVYRFFWTWKGIGEEGGRTLADWSAAS